MKMDSQSICRTCLREGEMKPLFETHFLSSFDNIRLSCADAIKLLFSVVAAEYDGLPKYICKKCVTKLKSTYNFKILVENSYNTLIAQTSSKLKLESNDHKPQDDICCDPESIKLFSEGQEIKVETDIKDNFNSHIEDEDDRNMDDDDFSSPEIKDILEEAETFKSVRNNVNKIKIPKQKKYQCSMCVKSFLSKQTLKKHEENHLKEKHKEDLSESKCDENPVDQNVVDKRMHCKFCGKKFLRVKAFKLHQLAHQDQPYTCTHPGCVKTFRTKRRLRVHLKVHTGERNFICQYCSHAARDKKQLTIHIRYLHTKEKNFLCGICGKAFVSSQARTCHAKRHENIRNHHCPHCDKSFIFANGLRQHLVIHTGEKRFPCSICDSRFSRKAHKQKHEAGVHGIEKPPSKRSSSFLPIPTLRAT